jgi:hypothetical protein
MQVASKGGGAWMRSLEDPIDAQMTQIHVANITDPAQGTPCARRIPHTHTSICLYTAAIWTDSVEASHTADDIKELIAKGAV